MTSPTDPHTSVFSHINGPPEDLLDRLAVTEICKGWPVYRDASEWQNFRSLFAPKATVWTSKRLQYSFISSFPHFLISPLSICH